MNPLEAASGDASACLRWLHVNLVLSRGVPLSEEQLRQLSHAVGDNAVGSSTMRPPRRRWRSACYGVCR
jgi:hypothetical protein